ncbi:MAG: hypothetical protein ABI321_21065 [Polyangia bacterium]
MTSFTWMLALSGCAGTATIAKPQAAAPVAAPVAKLAVELDVEDITRKEPWFQAALEEELSARGITVRHAKIDGGYVVRVRVESRNSDVGVSRATPVGQKGANRLDGVTEEQQQQAYRETPSPETQIYSAPMRPGKRTGPTESSDDFRITANATLSRHGSLKLISTSQFDERALDITPIAPGQRGGEWKTVYRGIALQIAKWLESQHLE